MGLLDEKLSYRETGLKKERLFNVSYYRPCSPSRPRIGSFPRVLPRWLIYPYPPVVVYRKTLNLYRKFQFIGSFKVIQCFVTIVGLYCQWLEFHVKIQSKAGKHCVFLPKRLEKGHFFLKLWLEFQP